MQGRERASNNRKGVRRMPPHTPQTHTASPTDSLLINSPTHLLIHSLIQPVSNSLTL